MPKTRVIKKTVYTFDELSESAKDKARQWIRDCNTEDNSWSEFVIEDAARMAEFMGLDVCQQRVTLMNGSSRYEPSIYWSGFWSQGDGACFEGSWDASKVDAKGLKDEAPEDSELHRIVDGFAEIANEYPEGSFRVRHTGHYHHSHSTSFDVGLPNAQEDELEYGSPEFKLLQVKLGKDEDTLIELARDFMDWIYKQLNKEWDYQNSDEQIDETIKANEYEFSEDGSIA